MTPPRDVLDRMQREPLSGAVRVAWWVFIVAAALGAAAVIGAA